MMYFGPRKKKFSQISLHRNTIILLVNHLVACSCFMCLECKQLDDDDSYPPPPPPPPPPSQKNNMPMFSIFLICTFGFAFVFFCSLTILKKYRSNLRNSRRRFESFADGAPDNFVDENQGPVSDLDHPIWYIRTVGLEQSVIDSIAVFKYKKGEALAEGTDCSVCLSEFEEDESLRLLPKCSHAFHITCIDTWLRSHINCPLCRAPIVRDDGATAMDTPLMMNTGQSVLDISEAATNEDGEDGDQGEGTSRSSIEGENIGPLPHEERKILERNNRVRVLSDLVDHRVRVGEDLEVQQSVRRSFSMDSSSASEIFSAVANGGSIQEEGYSNLDREAVAVKKLSVDMVAAKRGKKNSRINGSRNSFSFGQSVPIRMMKRSSSSNGNSSSLHKNSRSLELMQNTLS